jgi:hypothetical protein
MKKTYTVPVRLTEEMLRRLLVICDAEGRTPSNQFNFLLRNNIAYFEKTHGKITVEQLNKAKTGEYLLAAQYETTDL